ncbi:MAG TPA: EthD family reductase [Pyrinomonadaceae bacterium]|nr:EthD family reductase [Pyrinomonadaceae bacterium]
MAEAKLIVIYPRPTDIDAFEKLYQEEHVPMAVEKLAGKTKIVATKVIHSLEGSAPYYRIAEIHFPSMKALKACASSESAKETLGHAVAISTGGAPLFLVGEEETFSFEIDYDDTLMAQ